MVAGSAQCAIMGLPAAGAKFLKRHLFLVIVLCSAFSAQTAEAADGNPGGQGGPSYRRRAGAVRVSLKFSKPASSFWRLVIANAPRRSSNGS